MVHYEPTERIYQLSQFIPNFVYSADSVVTQMLMMGNGNTMSVYNRKCKRQEYSLCNIN